MTIPTISTLPTAPARTDAPATFISRADAFLAALVTMQGELNTSIGAMNTDIGGIAANVTAAQAAQTAAELAETNAETAVTNAETAVTNAEAAETNAQIYAAAAQAAAGIPSLTGNAGKALSVNGAEDGVEWTAIETDPTLATQTKTYTSGEVSTLTLSSAVTSGVPVVSVTKEVPQTGVTNNQWDVNSTAENYTRVNSAPATTLDFVGYGIAQASFVDSFSVASQDINPFGFCFSDDGSKMFVVGTSGDAVYEYALSTSFDVSTASFVASFSVAAQEITPQGIAFNTDGTKMFVVGVIGDDVNEYILSTGFDVSTASYSQNFSLAGQEATSRDIKFNTDGTKMFVVGEAGDDINEYTLSTGFDVSTASFTTNFSVASEDTTPRGLAFNSSGTKMFVSGVVNDKIFQYSLSTPFDLSTASYDSVSFDNSGQTSQVNALAFNTDGTKLFFVSSVGDAVYEYSIPLVLELGTGSFTSADVGKTIYANSGELILTSTGGAFVETTAPSSYSQVASGNWEMYAVVYNTTDGDLQLSGKEGFDISTASFVDSFSVSSQEAFPRDIAFNTDGTKMFIVGNDGDDVNEYILSTGFDVSTASYSQNFSVSAQDTAPQGIAFNTDGTKMFIVGTTGDDVNEYTLGTGFDVSTASYSQNFSVASQDASPRGIAFNTDGTKMFIVGHDGDNVDEYTLGTGFDVSTASYSQNFSYASQESNARGIEFNNNGTKMFIVGGDGDDVNEYTLGTGFDISTASYSQNFSVSSEDSDPQGIAFNTDGSKMFIVGFSGVDVNEYTLAASVTLSGYHAAHTTLSIDSTYWTDINSMTADESAGDGTVYYAVSTDDRTTWSIADNTDGIRDIVRNNSGTWEYNSNGTYGSETWTAASTNTELSALQEAMEGATDVTDQFDISTASYSQNFSVSAQDISPNGIAFNTDGTKMFIVGSGGDDVNEYTLSTGFDVSTATYSQNFSVASQETTPEDIAFNNDGTKMFIVGNDGDDVNEYTLGTGFDVSTATYSQNFSVSAQETGPQGIAFNTDGTKMFIVGSNGQEVNEYTLGTGFDVSTASYSQNFSVSSQDTVPTAIAFNNDGTKMFIVGNTGDDVNEYTLGTGFDISTATYSQNFSVSSQDTSPTGIAFNTDGTKMFILGNTGDNVNEYTVGTTSYTNQMDKTQLEAVTDANQFTLGNDLDLAIIFNLSSGSTVPSSDGVSINYDANTLNEGAIIGTDYDFDFPATDKVRITALADNNLKVRVV